MDLHVVIGFGPAGAATARLLAGQGHSVRVVTRSGGRAEPGIEHVPLDAAAAGRLTEAVRGAAAIHQCASPPYHRWTRDWPALAASVNQAAEATGAVLVMLGGLYGYGPVGGEPTEDLPLAATGPKGRVRAELWERARALHEAGRIKAVEVRASDFFGPGVTDGGHLASRVVPRLLPPAVVRALSVVSPLLRELREIRYRFDRPFVVDSTAYREAFAAAATPLVEQVEATVDWWRARLAGN